MGKVFAFDVVTVWHNKDYIINILVPYYYCTHITLTHNAVSVTKCHALYASQLSSPDSS